jgi:transcriptional regulator with XRE-family HTH domain
MRGMDPLWSSAQARTLVDHQDPGGLVRLGRIGRGWRQADLGERLGCSASTVSRMEQRGIRTTDLNLLRRAAQEVGVPPHVLGAALGLNMTRATKVATDGPRCAKEDPMRRRTLLAAAGLVAPAQLLAGVDDALAVTPAPTGSTVPLATRLARARSLFDAGRHADLLEALPGLLADAHDAALSRTDLAHARLSSCYSLATQLLVKIGRYDRARLTADRATVYAELSGASLAAAAAARELSIVLRHQDQQGAAECLILGAAAKVEATGLTTPAQSAAYAQMLCTTAYTAARAGHRDQALGMIQEASRAARGLPPRAPAERLFPITPPGSQSLRSRCPLGAGRRGGRDPSGPDTARRAVPHGGAQGPYAHRSRTGLVAVGQAGADGERAAVRSARLTGRSAGPTGDPADR